MEKAALDPTTRAALQKLADIAEPPPVPWIPQTWGWAALAILLLALALWGLWRWRRYRQANRYRREALAKLSAIELRLGKSPERASVLVDVAELLKQTALGAWRRPAVASLSGHDWVAFLRQTTSPPDFPDDAAALLDDLEYRDSRSLGNIDEAGTRSFIAAARRWIERHHVPA